MSKNKKIIIIASIFVVLAVGFSILYLFLSRIPVNDNYLSGNTGGNLYNGGLFCESGGKVYFANSFDGNALYSMNVDETEFKKLINSPVFSINAGGDYLYYCLNNAKNVGSGLGHVRPAMGLYRCKTNGRSPARLKNTPVITATLCGNYVYYLNFDGEKANTLNKIKIDNSEDTVVVDYVIDPSTFANGAIYFAGTRQDHNLYRLTTNTDGVSAIMEGNIFQPVFSDNYVYYMDLNQNYRLCRYSIMSETSEVLTADRVEAYNVGSGVIFYQIYSSTDPGLYRMNTDGSNPVLVAAGNYTKISMTSQYAYYRQFGDDTTLYHTSLYGYPEATVFDAAQLAIPIKK